MATVIRIKRRLDEEPTENIFIKSKRSRKEDADEDTGNKPDEETSTVLMRVGTVETKEEPIEPLVLKAIKKGRELKENYKKLGTGTSYKNKTSSEVKRRAISNRYKIISQSRGIGEPEQLDKDGASVPANEGTAAANERVDVEGAEALPSTSMEVSLFDAVLAKEKLQEDVITCNGVPMESEKYVYDVFYSTRPINWEEVMEQNMCKIEKEVYELVSESDSEPLDDDDDENEEGNWRNDYPDYDDSPCEDEEEYLNSQLRKHSSKRYDTDESYDEADYEEDGFDVEGNLIMASKPYSLIKLMEKAHMENSDSED